MATPSPDAERDAALRRRIEALRAELERLEALRADHQRNQARAASELALVWQRLVTAVLPELRDDVLDDAATRLGLPSLAASHARAEAASRQTTLERRISEGRASPSFASAEVRAAELSARARDLAEHADALRRSLTALTRDADFRALEENRFGTPEGPGWWTLSHYRLRSLAEAVLERHGPRLRATDLDTLRAARDREQRALTTLEQEIATLRREELALRALVHDVAEAEQALVALPERLLEERRREVERELRALPTEALVSAFDDDPRLRTEVRAVSGVLAKARYLDAVFEHWVERTRRELLARVQDDEIALEDAHLARSGTSAIAIDAETRARVAEVGRRVHAYEAAASRLLAFARYGETNPLAGELWWDAMSGGHLDGSFIDEVAWHRTMRRGGAPFSPGSASPLAARQEESRRREALAQEALAAAHAAVAREAPAEAAAPAPVELPALELDDD